MTSPFEGPPLAGVPVAQETGAQLMGVVPPPVLPVYGPWLSVKDPKFGARGDGVTDDYLPLQAALNFIVGNQDYNSVLVFPPGNYMTSKLLTYNGGGSLRICGSIAAQGYPGGSSLTAIAGSAAASEGVLSITDTTVVNVEDMNFNGSSATVAGSIGLNINQAGWVNVNRCYWGPADGVTVLFDTALNIENVNTSGIISSIMNGNTYGVTVNSAGAYFNNTIAYHNAGTNGACMNIYNGETVIMSIAGTEGGDRGLWIQGPSTGGTQFVQGFNFGVNNPAICGIDLQYGNTFTANQFWLGGPNTASPLSYGIIVRDTYAGAVSLSQTFVGGFAGHGIWIDGATQAASGFEISGGAILNNGWASKATYDDIHISAPMQYGVVSIHDVLFELDEFLPSSTQCRSAIYVESGVNNVIANGNIWPSSGWGTSPTVGTVTGTNYPVTT